MAGNVGGVGSAQNYYNQYTNAKNTAAPVAEEDTSAANPVDTYTPSYGKVADPETVGKLWKDTDRAGEALKKLVQKLLGGANGQSYWADKLKNLKLSDADRAEAQSMISEDGEFGVKKTTERIMGFAKALVGDNASDEDIEKMRAAVQKGFDEVAKMFGGFDKLPDVSKQTYEAIMKSFDEWKSGETTEAAE